MATHVKVPLLMEKPENDIEEDDNGWKRCGPLCMTPPEYFWVGIAILVYYLWIAVMILMVDRYLPPTENRKALEICLEQLHRAEYELIHL